MVLNETFNVGINKNIYHVKLIEDMHGPKRIVIPKETVEKVQDRDESNWNSEDEGGVCDQDT